MFGRKPKITLFEGEEITDSFKLRPSQLVTGMAFGNTGDFHITNKRIICDLPQFNIHHSVFHENIISFNWGRNIPTEGTRFTMLYSYINNFGNQGYMTVELRVHDKKKIEKILSKYSYYNKPQVIPTTDLQNNSQEQNISQKPSYENNPLEILKIRYAKGEITQEQFESMKKNL